MSLRKILQKTLASGLASLVLAGSLASAAPVPSSEVAPPPPGQVASGPGCGGEPACDLDTACPGQDAAAPAAPATPAPSPAVSEAQAEPRERPIAAGGSDETWWENEYRFLWGILIYSATGGLILYNNI